MTGKERKYSVPLRYLNKLRPPSNRFFLNDKMLWCQHKIFYEADDAPYLCNASSHCL